MSGQFYSGARAMRRFRAAGAAAFAWLSATLLAQSGGLLGVNPGAQMPNQKATSSAPIGPVRKDFQKPTAPKNGPEPFLTEAVDTDIDTYTKFGEQLIYPTQKKTEQPFYDIPFAVNVPFEVPFDGGVTRVFFDVNVVWDDPELNVRVGDDQVFQGGRGWGVHRQGIYRLDGGRITPESVAWEIDSKDTTKMIAPPNAPFPLLLNGALPTATDNGALTTQLDISSGSFNTITPRRPFTNRDGQRFGFAAGRPLVLRAAPTGWYALWFTVSPRVTLWPPQKLRADDTLHAKIHVHYIVARRERFNGSGDYFTPDDLDYLWDGRDVKPTRAIDPKLVRAFSVEIPVVLRRDGWMFKQVEFRRDENNFTDRAIEQANGPWDVNATTVRAFASTHANTITATYEQREFHREQASNPWPAKPMTASTLTWDIQLPAEIPDGGPGEITAKGKVEENGFDQDYWQRAKTGRVVGTLPNWMWGVGTVDRERDKLSVATKLKRVEEPEKRDYDRFWAAKLGDVGGTKYFPPERSFFAPKATESKRYWIFAEPLDATDVAQPADRRKLLYQDLGPQPIFSVKFGPWTADAYYCRKKDFHPTAEAPPAAGPTKAVDELDPFWKWYPGFSRLLGKQLAEVSKLEIEMALLRESLQSHRRSALLLLDTYQTVIAGTSTSDWFFGSGETRASMSDAAITRLIQAAHRQNDLAEQNRTLIRQHGTDIRAAYEAILAELKRVNSTFIELHPELSNWERHYRRKLEAEDLKIALALSDLGAVQQAAEKAQASAQNAETFAAIGQVQLENGDPIGALASMRRAAQLAPDSADVRQRMTAVECALIRVALDKSQATIAQARKIFFGYMKDRGYGDRDNAAATAWVGSLHNPLSRLDTESAWNIFTTGITGAFSGLYVDESDRAALDRGDRTTRGRAEQEGRALDAVERDMTTAYIGGQVILRLRMRGHTLEEIKGTSEIKGMSSRAICDALMEGAPNAPKIDEARGRELGLAIHTALQLPEFKALLAFQKNGDIAEIRAGVKQGYWNLKDVGNTWAEYIGDISSPKNLVMLLLPSSVGTVGGQLQGFTYWAREEAALLQAATRTGAADTGTMVIARLAGWDRALGWIGSTKGGEFLLEELQRSQKYQEGLALLAQQGSLSARASSVGWSLAKIAAIMGVQGIAVEGTKELVGPGAALAVESMLLFGSDTELLCKFLDGARIPRAPLVAAIENQFLPAAERQLKQLKDVSNAVPQIEHVLQDMKKGAPAPPPQRRARPDLDAGAGTPPVLGARPTGSGTAPPALGDGARTPPVANARTTGSGTAPPRSGNGDIIPDKAVTAPIPGASPPKGTGTQPPRNISEDSSGLISHDALTPPPGPAVNSHKSIPNGQPGNDCSIAEAAAEEGIEQGTNNGANLASRSLAPDGEVEIEALSQKIGEAKQLAQKLKSVPLTGKLPERPLALENAESLLGNYQVPPQPQAGSTWARAENAKFAGDYETAENLYLQLKMECARDALAGKPLGPHDLPIELIDDCLTQVAKLKVAGDKPGVDVAIRKAVLAPIEDGQVASILALKRTQIAGGATGNAFLTNDGKFFVKEVKVGGRVVTNEAVLQQTVEAEVVNTVLKRVLNLPQPGNNVRVKWVRDSAGQVVMESAEIVSQRVPGVRLSELAEDEVFLLHNEVSMQQGVDVAVGDYDPKADNFMYAGGVLYRIDSSQADIRGIRWKNFFNGRLDHPMSVEGIMGNDFWYQQCFQIRNEVTDRALIRKTWAMHQAMTYEPAAQPLNRLRDILANPAERAQLEAKLREAYRSVYRDHPDFKTGSDAELKQLSIGSYGDRYFGDTPEQIDQALKGPVAETLEMLDKRVPAAERAMHRLNLRNGQPLAPPRPQSRLWPAPDRAVRRLENIFPFIFPEKIAA